MPSLSELKKKIRGVTSTRQITNAMKMVAGARFARAARQRSDARYYESELEKVLFGFLSLLGDNRKGGLFSLFGNGAPVSEKRGLIVVAADKGLAGDFNNALLRAGDNYLRKNGKQVTALIAVGRKAVEHYRNVKIPVKFDHDHFFNRFDFSMADTIGQEAVNLFLEQNLGELIIVHSKFKSMMKQDLTVEKLLPIEPTPPNDGLFRSTVIEPVDEEEEVLRAVLPMYIKAKLYGILRDSYTAELAARMSAMDNATRNAGTLIDTVTLEMNKVRQAVITREIAEIIATNEVVK